MAKRTHQSSSSLKIPLPALYADYLSVIFPLPQAIHRDSHFPRKGFLPHTEGFPIGPDTFALSIIKELIELIQEVRHGNTIECRKVLHHLQGDVLSNSALNIDVNRSAHTRKLCNFCLHQATAMSAPTEPVRYIIDFLISSIPLIELRCFQNLSWGTQHKTMYE